jgi:transposase
VPVRAFGLDVHRDFCEVAIAEEGNVRSAGRIVTRPEVIELFAASLAADDRVVLEVCGNAWEIARIIEPHVARVVVVSLSDTGICHARAKTDRLDARTLAKLLAAGSLDSVWMPDERTRVMRRRLARRDQLVTARTRAKNEIHAILIRRLKGPPGSQRSVRQEGPSVVDRARAADRGTRDARQRPAPDRLSQCKSPGRRAVASGASGRSSDR